MKIFSFMQKHEKQVPSIQLKDYQQIQNKYNKQMNLDYRSEPLGHGSPEEDNYHV